MIVSEGQTETVSSSEQTKDAPVETTEMKLEEENQDEQGTTNASHMMPSLKV